VAQLRHAVALLASFKPRTFGPDEAIALGALVELESDEDDARYLVVPAAGGLELDVEGTRITTVTPTAPLGAALIGRFVDEDVDVLIPKGARRFRIVAIA
jgi:transcription elongation GreA/GreB family factor